MFKVHLFESASADLRESYDWYEDQVAGLGDRFFGEVDEYLDLISENPFQFQVQFSEKYRFAPLRRFPFRIVYRIDQKQKVVYVTSVFHTSRDPKRF